MRSKLGIVAAGVVLVAIGAMSSCARVDLDGDGENNSRLQVQLQANHSMESSRTLSKASGDVVLFTPEVEDFDITIAKASGSVAPKTMRYGEMPNIIELTSGRYDIIATYGSLEEEGFEKPAYYGSSEVSILEDETVSATVTSALINTAVSISYTEAFKNYFASYETTVHSAGGGYFKFEKDEKRAVYVKPGNVTVQMDLVKTNGAELKFEPLEIKDTKAKTHYHITFDIENGTGDASLKIIFDETTETVPETIVLSDELINAPCPTIKAYGIESDVPVTVLAGESVVGDLNTNIIAYGGFKKVELTTQCANLIEKGWPAEINLADATVEQQAKLKSMGLSVVGLWEKNMSKIAIIDFKQVLKQISAVGECKFILKITDKMTKVSDEFVLNVNAVALETKISNPSPMQFNTTTLSFDFAFNGNETQNISFKTLDINSGVLAVCPMSEFNKIEEGKYRVTITVPASVDDLPLHTFYKDNDVKTTIIKRVEPQYSISIGENEVWGGRAYLTISSENTDPEAIAELSAAYVSSDEGATWQQVETESLGNKIILKGLLPETEYLAKLSIAGSLERAGEAVSFVTEGAPVLPNGTFEDLEETINIPSINKGGRYRSSFLSSYRYATTSYLVNEPTGWATVNKKTCNDAAKTRNTWFVVPSTLNVAGYSEGSVAMTIRSVGWDLAGTVPADYSGASYCANKPANIAHSSAGKLFIGSYDFTIDEETGEMSETYTEGVDFTGRPIALSGYYKYATDASDTEETAMVYIDIYNGETKIGSAATPLTEAGQYTAFTAIIDYNKINVKATSLRVMITSTNRASNSIEEEDENVKVTKIASSSTQNAFGGILTVSDLKFVY